MPWVVFNDKSGKIVKVFGNGNEEFEVAQKWHNESIQSIAWVNGKPKAGDKI